MKIKEMKITDAEKLLKDVAISKGLKLNRAKDLQIVLGLLEERNINVNKFYDPSTKKDIK
jgi:hypothetical protein